MSESPNSQFAPYQRLPESPSQSFQITEYKGKSTGCTWHFHPECQLSLVLSGNGRRIIGETMEPISPGEITLLGSNLPHVWRYDATAEVHTIVAHFREDFAGVEFLDKPEMQHIRMLLARARQGLQVQGQDRITLQKSIQKLAGLQGFEKVIGLMDILNTLSNSRSLRILSESKLNPEKTKLSIERLKAVYTYLENHFDQAITRDQAASLAHLSPSAFSRFFRQHAGTSFQKYLNDRRIDHACLLLRKGDLSITDIAFQCGFLNLTSFNRSFRRVKGKSPSTYRQEIAHILQMAME